MPNPHLDKAIIYPYIEPSVVATGEAVYLTLENWQTIGALNAYGGIPCPPGYFCNEGSTEPQLCPEGSVRKDELGRWISDCTSCPRG